MFGIFHERHLTALHSWESFSHRPMTLQFLRFESETHLSTLWISRSMSRFGQLSWDKRDLFCYIVFRIPHPLVLGLRQKRDLFYYRMRGYILHRAKCFAFLGGHRKNIQRTSSFCSKKAVSYTPTYAVFPVLSVDSRMTRCFHTWKRVSRKTCGIAIYCAK